jgi:small subunit ribosomal protein S2
MQRTTITDLLEAGVHFGHQTKRWNPKMKPFIYGTRNGITIFDLTVTMRHLAAACEFLRETAAKGGSVLFVGAKRQAQEVVREAAEQCGMFYMCDRWLGGTLTNQRAILSRVGYLKKLQQMETDGSMAALPKKEVAGLRRERGKLEKTLRGVAEMKGLPAALVVVDVGREDIAVREAVKLGIPVVAIVDSNCDPENIDYAIPGNDDALRAIKVVIDALAGALREGSGARVKSDEAPAVGAPPAEATAGREEETEAATPTEAEGAATPTEAEGAATSAETDEAVLPEEAVDDDGVASEGKALARRHRAKE